MLDKYNWNLEELLGNKTIEQLFNEWKKINDKIVAKYPKFLDTKENFIEFLEINDKEEKISNRLMNYISNKHNENLKEAKWIMWDQKISKVSHDYSLKTFDYTQRIIKNKEKILSYLKDKKISEYKYAYDLLFKNEKHILNDEQEKVISKLGGINGEGEIFEILTNVDIKFNDVKDSKNKSFKIKTQSDVVNYLKSNDRVLRKNAWLSYNGEFYKFANTLCMSLFYNYKSLNRYSQIHNYKDYVDGALENDEVNGTFLMNLYKSVEKFNFLYKEFNLNRDTKIKKLFKLDKVNAWDRSLDLIKTSKKFEVEEGKEIVYNALKILGKEYSDTIKNAMNEHWVSYLPKENKREGAYSIGGTAGLKKYYVLMNWNKNIDSIFTLSHELGHSLNSYYTNKKQKIYTHNKIFYAEIASVANEVLTSVYLLEKYKNDKQMKLLILDNLIKDFFATTTRQIIFSNWEYEANKWVNSGEEFSVNKSLELYSKIKEKYTSIKSKKNDENTKKSDSIILRIPHFYHGNFYVYKYAIGQLVAFYVVNKILNNKKDFINQYINFLSSGNSKSPLETIKLLGFEFNDKCINESIQLLKKFIKEYKEL